MVVDDLVVFLASRLVVVCQLPAFGFLCILVAAHEERDCHHCGQSHDERASFHILFFDRLCSVKAGAFVDVPTGHPLLFCRYEPFLCLPCQHGEEDGLWRVATLPADCCRGLARAANGSPFPCRSARLLFRLSCSLYWHVVSMNRQMQSYEFLMKKLRE